MKGAFGYYIYGAVGAACGCMIGDYYRHQNINVTSTVITSVAWPITVPIALESAVTGSKWTFIVKRSIPADDSVTSIERVIERN